MKTIFKSNIFILLLLFATALFGQTEPSLDKEVEVIKAYQPSISDAQKIMVNPSITDTINYSPTFDYRIYSKDIPVVKNINHLPVVKLGSPPLEKSNTGYAKAGFGNAVTPYGEVFVNTSPSRSTDFGLHLFHYSTNPSVPLYNELIVKAPYSNNLAKIFARNQFRKAVLDWEVAYNRIRHNYYGFPGTDSLFYQRQELVSTTLNEKQVFNTASTAMTLRNLQARSNMDYNIGVGYNFLWNLTGQTAHQANYDGLYTLRKSKYHLLFDTQFGYYLQNNINHNFNSALTNHQFFEAAINPQIAFSKDLFDLKAGFNLSTLIGADAFMMWHISPKVYFAYHPIKGILSLFAGIDGGFKPNNYQQAVERNPYMDYMLDLKPSEEVISFYGGLKGKFSRKISYLFDVNYAINQNEAYYYLAQTSILADTVVNNLFNVDYDDVNVLRFGGNVRYSDKKLTLELKGNYYMHEAKTLTTLSHTPQFDASLFTAFQITPQIRTTLGSKVIGPREATYKIFEPPYTKSETYTLPTIIDINIGADYALNKELGFFINAQNILNRKTEIWHGYNTQGLLIMLGASYIF